MSARTVLTVFEKYQKERVAFVTAVAEMATRPQVIFPQPVFLFPSHLLL